MTNAETKLMKEVELELDDLKRAVAALEMGDDAQADWYVDGATNIWGLRKLRAERDRVACLYGELRMASMRKAG